MLEGYNWHRSLMRSKWHVCLKKESKLNLIFKNLILRFKGSKKTEITKMTESDFFKNMKTEEEEAENLELNKYIEEE